VSYRVGARHSSKLCDAPTDSDSDTSSDEEQPDVDVSTNAVIATVAAPVSDMNDYEVCLVVQRDTRIALVPCGHQRFVRPAQTRWNVRDVDVPSVAQTSKWPRVFPDVQLRYVMLTVHLQVDLNGFGVANFVSTILYAVCYCIILLAGCFLRTFWF